MKNIFQVEIMNKFSSGTDTRKFTDFMNKFSNVSGGRPNSRMFPRIRIFNDWLSKFFGTRQKHH